VRVVVRKREGRYLIHDDAVYSDMLEATRL